MPKFFSGPVHAAGQIKATKGKLSPSDDPCIEVITGFIAPPQVDARTAPARELCKKTVEQAVRAATLLGAATFAQQEMKKGAAAAADILVRRAHIMASKGKTEKQTPLKRHLSKQVTGKWDSKTGTQYPTYEVLDTRLTPMSTRQLVASGTGNYALQSGARLSGLEITCKIRASRPDAPPADLPSALHLPTGLDECATGACPGRHSRGR